MNIRLYFKDLLRGVRDAIYISVCYIFDVIRFLRFGGWRNFYAPNRRIFKNAKIYHAIEKSLSSHNFDKKRGHAASALLRDFLEASIAKGGYSETSTDLAAYKALELFDEATGRDLVTPSLRAFFRERKVDAKINVGSVEIKDNRVPKAWAIENKSQLFSRRSVRDFSDRKVSDGTLDRCLSNAFSAPSACNRNPWYIYKTNRREVIDRVLGYQNGNAGFGHLSQGLFVVTVDLCAYDNAAERRQAWVDGGIFLMNLVTAIHVEGLVSCCLNWCKYPWQEHPIKSDLGIPPSREIIAMVALGYPKREYNVCASQRPVLATVVESIK